MRWVIAGGRKEREKREKERREERGTSGALIDTRLESSQLSIHRQAESVPPLLFLPIKSRKRMTRVYEDGLPSRGPSTSSLRSGTVCFQNISLFYWWPLVPPHTKQSDVCGKRPVPESTVRMALKYRVLLVYAKLHDSFSFFILSSLSSSHVVTHSHHTLSLFFGGGNKLF